MNPGMARGPYGPIGPRGAKGFGGLGDVTVGPAFTNMSPRVMKRGMERTAGFGALGGGSMPMAPRFPAQFRVNVGPEFQGVMR